MSDLKRGLWIATVGAVAIALGWIFLRAPAHIPRTVSKGPLSEAHAPLEQNCRACHEERWEGLRRVVTGNDRWRNRACLDCHSRRVLHDPETSTPLHTSAGSPGERQLAYSSCHRDHRGGTSLTHVENFACTECHADRARLPESVPRIATFSIDGPSPHPDFRQLVDGSGLSFNHRLHVDPSSYDASGRTRPEEAQACARCHEHDDDGGMQPIGFDRHCAGCHRLEVAGSWRGEERREGRLPNGAVPHQTPEAIQVYLDGRVGEERLRRDLERKLYDLPSGVCARCHELADDGTELPRIAPTVIPNRWWTRATFDHRSHRTDPVSAEPVACTRCHQGTAESDASSDGLLPRIETCRECHSAPRVALATDRCVSCHVFHRDASR